MKVTLKQHLERLRAIEVLTDGGNPDNVPTYRDLETDTGLDYQTIYRFATNKSPQARINADTVTRIIKALRNRGFNTKVGDILVVEDGDLGELMPTELTLG